MKEQNLVSKWYIGLTVLLVIIGVIMLVWPNLTMDLLGIMIGICMLVVGLVHVIIYFTREHMGSVMQMDLTVGVVLAAFGSFMLMHKDFVALLLPFAASVILLVGGLSLIQNSLDMRRMAFLRWQILLSFAIAMILMGIILLYNPFKDRALIYVIGVCLILDGLASIVAILMISHRVKKMARGAVYTGRENLIVEQGSQGIFGRKKAGQAPDPTASAPVETVDAPVSAPPKEEKKKGGLFGFFRKKKKADEGTDLPDASDDEAAAGWNAADAGTDDDFAAQGGAEGSADPSGETSPSVSAEETAAFRQTSVDQAVLPQEESESDGAAESASEVMDDPFVLGDEPEGTDAAQEDTAQDADLTAGTAADGTVKDPFDLG